MQQGLPFDPLWFAPLLFMAFACFWLAITGLLGLVSGWFRLQRAFPDRVERPIQRLRFQSGAMGGGVLPVNFGNCLTLDICPTGLRVAVLQFLGPFQQPFFVPWTNIRVTHRRILFRRFCRLGFGVPEAGSLSLQERTATRLASISPLCLPPRA